LKRAKIVRRFSLAFLTAGMLLVAFAAPGFAACGFAQ
jgi:hypothetical protein